MRLEHPRGVVRHLRRGAGQGAVGGVDDGYGQLRRIDQAAVLSQPPGGVTQFRRQLHACGACAHDRDPNLVLQPCLYPRRLGQEATVELLGILRRIQAVGMLGHARRPEVIDRAADGQHDGVESNRARRQKLGSSRQSHRIARRRGHGRQLEASTGGVQRQRLAQHEAKAVASGLRSVASLLLPRHQKTGGDLVQPLASTDGSSGGRPA